MIMAADPEDKGAYLAAIDQFSNRFPEDPALAMLTFDTAVMRGDMETLKESKRYVDEWTGGDPYFDGMVAASYVKMDQLEAAAESARNVDPEQLDVADAHDMLVGIGLATQDYDMVLKNLLILRDQYGYQFSDVRDAEGFECFVASPQFEEWQ